MFEKVISDEQTLDNGDILANFHLGAVHRTHVLGVAKLRPRIIESDVLNKLSGIGLKICTALVSLYNRPVVLILLRIQNLIQFGYSATQVVCF